MKKITPVYTSLFLLFLTFIIYGVYDLSWDTVWCDLRLYFSIGEGNALWISLLILVLFFGGYIISYLIFTKMSFCWDFRIHKRHVIFDSYRVIDKYSKRICFLNLCLLIGILFFYHTDSFEKHTDKNLFWEYPLTIAHAGGEIEGHEYSNSLEAILTNYEKGHRTFEIDFSVTSDQVLVAKHDWNMVVQEGMESGYVPTAEEFKSIPIYGAYTPLTLEELCFLMEEYPDIWIVTDVKDANADEMRQAIAILVETAKNTGVDNILDRFVVQVYNEETFYEVREIYSFDKWIYTLYQCWDGNEQSFPEYARFCHANKIDIITIWDEYATSKVLAIAKNYGIEVYVHTVNDREMAQEYINKGVMGVYTDSISPLDLRRKE